MPRGHRLQVFGVKITRLDGTPTSTQCRSCLDTISRGVGIEAGTDRISPICDNCVAELLPLLQAGLDHLRRTDG